MRSAPSDIDSYDKVWREIHSPLNATRIGASHRLGNMPEDSAVPAEGQHKRLPSKSQAADWQALDA
jgi:hypothetical protein